MAVFLVSWSAVNGMSTSPKSYKNTIYSVALSLILVQTVLGERTAFINVYNNRKVDRDSEFQVLGNFTGIGAVENAEGRLQMLSSNCANSADKGLSKEKDWIGVLYLTTVTDEDFPIDKPCCSFIDRVTEVMLFGASALIILANVDTHVWMQLDASQLFSKPIVFINETKYISKFISSVQRAGKSFLRANISFNISYYDFKTISTITLWSTCGRARGGGYWGTVCFGGPSSNSQAHYSNWLYIVMATLVVGLLFIMLHSPHLFRNPMYDADDIDEALQNLTVKVLSKMKTRCYSYKKRKHKGDDEEPKCSICLERYFPKQVIRVLPCSHEYHSKCVDTWLIKHRTCPLCKLNIIDHKFGNVKIET
ncbi:RING finger protein 215-like isoform X1 [Ptychodera flava]|uniref:RING finger protein 215-like isoform X1 n=1 Tax=Ptychodera flava TaxID=63121 RepID=UPI00396A5D67